MAIDNLYVAVTAVLMVLFVLFELFAPARTYDIKQKRRSYITNILIFGGDNIVTFFLQVSAVFAVVIAVSPTADFFMSLPIWVQGVAGVVLLDFLIWLWHLINHKIPFLWAFHKCHHSEQYLNASSALRFHIGELLLSVVWKSAVLILFGIPLWVFLLSEFLLTAFATFHHANIELPSRVRKLLEMVIITPYLHRVHHSDIRSEHDANYGVIFSFWDRLFNTLKKIIPNRIGLKGVEEKGFISFLFFPINKK